LNGVTSSYVYGRGLISQNQNGNSFYYHADALGNTRALTNFSGDILSTYQYDAFGSLINSTGSIDNKYLFAGEQYDSNLKSYYLRDRYYDSNIGRFTRRDAYQGNLNSPFSLHKYLYANANPVLFTDPSGFTVVGGIGELSATFAILAILLAISATTLTGDTAQEKICRYTIDEPHIFSPIIYSDRLAGFHSTDRAVEGVNFEWVTQPPSNSEDVAFSAMYTVPDHLNLTKVSSFFPLGLPDFIILSIIDNAYKKTCPPYGRWTAVGTDFETGETLPIEGYVTNHRITTAYPGGLPNTLDIF
jgi:RHS repeat-associated protein